MMDGDVDNNDGDDDDGDGDIEEDAKLFNPYKIQYA